MKKQFLQSSIMPGLCKKADSLTADPTTDPNFNIFNPNTGLQAASWAAWQAAEQGKNDAKKLNPTGNERLSASFATTGNTPGVQPGAAFARHVIQPGVQAANKLYTVWQFLKLADNVEKQRNLRSQYRFFGKAFGDERKGEAFVKGWNEGRNAVKDSHVTLPVAAARWGNNFLRQGVSATNYEIIIPLLEHIGAHDAANTWRKNTEAGLDLLSGQDAEKSFNEAEDFIRKVTSTKKPSDNPDLWLAKMTGPISAGATAGALTGATWTQLGKLLVDTGTGYAGGMSGRGLYTYLNRDKYEAARSAMMGEPNQLSKALAKQRGYNTDDPKDMLQFGRTYKRELDRRQDDWGFIGEGIGFNIREGLRSPIRWLTSPNAAAKRSPVVYKKQPTSIPVSKKPPNSTSVSVTPSRQIAPTSPLNKDYPSFLDWSKKTLKDVTTWLGYNKIQPEEYQYSFDDLYSAFQLLQQDKNGDGIKNIREIAKNPDSFSKYLKRDPWTPRSTFDRFSEALGGVPEKVGDLLTRNTSGTIPKATVGDVAVTYLSLLDQGQNPMDRKLFAARMAETLYQRGAAAMVAEGRIDSRHIDAFKKQLLDLAKISSLPPQQQAVELKKVFGGNLPPAVLGTIFKMAQDGNLGQALDPIYANGPEGISKFIDMFSKISDFGFSSDPGARALTRNLTPLLQVDFIGRYEKELNSAKDKVSFVKTYLPVFKQLSQHGVSLGGSQAAQKLAMDSKLAIQAQLLDQLQANKDEPFQTIQKWLDLQDEFSNLGFSISNGQSSVLTQHVNGRVWDAIMKNPLNIHKALALMARKARYKDLSSFLKNPWAFYGTLIGLPLTVSLMFNLFGENDDQQSSQKQHRQAVQVQAYAPKQNITDRGLIIGTV